MNTTLGTIKANKKIVVLTDESLSDARSVLSQAIISSIVSEPTGLLAAATCTTVLLLLFERERERERESARERETNRCEVCTVSLQRLYLH